MVQLKGSYLFDLFLYIYFYIYFFCVESALVVFEKGCGTKAVEAYANR